MGKRLVIKNVDFSANAIDNSGPTPPTPPTPTGGTEVLQPVGNLLGYVPVDTLVLTEHANQQAYYYQVYAGDLINFTVVNSSSTPVWCRGGFFTSVPVIGATATASITNGTDGEHINTGGAGSYTVTQNGYVLLAAFKAGGVVINCTRTY